jgi:hypothetical protein
MQQNSATKTRRSSASSAAEQPSRQNRPIVREIDQATSRKNTKALFASETTGGISLVEASIDVGLGNALFIRGEGNGLSWEKGQQLTCLDAAKWVWSGRQTKDKTVFKLLLNDQIWAQGEDVIIEPGRIVEIVPRF